MSSLLLNIVWVLTGNGNVVDVDVGDASNIIWQLHHDVICQLNNHFTRLEVLYMYKPYIRTAYRTMWLLYDRSNIIAKNQYSTTLWLAAYMNSLRQYVFCQLLTHQSWPRLRHFYVKLYRLLIPTWKSGTTTVTVSYVSSQAADLIVRNMARLLTLYLVLLFTCDTNLVKVATHDLSVPVGNRSMGRICNMSLWMACLFAWWSKITCMANFHIY